MVQSISISVNSEFGERLSWADVDFAPVFNELMTRYNNADKEAVKAFPFIATIDPYGTTFFNEYQLPLLIADIERFVSVQSTGELNEIARKIIEFIEKEKGAHKLIGFIGD